MPKRSKSNLAVDPAAAPAGKEPLSGPGSATCFCRVMNRRAMAREARQSLVLDVSHEETRSVCVAPLVARLGRAVPLARFGRARV